MTQTTTTPRRRAIVAAVCALAVGSGCQSIAAPAAKYAGAEESAATGIMPMAEVAERLCVRRAQYTFLEEVIHLLPSTPVTGEPWPTWYAAAAARSYVGQPVTWKRACDEEAQSGAAVRALLRGLRLHARALAALAGTRTFDASGLDRASSAVSTLATKLGASPQVDSSVATAGSTFASVATKFVALYRQGKLDEAVATSDLCMKEVFDDLQTMIKVLGDDLRLAKEQRDAVVQLLQKQHAYVESTPRLMLASGFELSSDAGAEFSRQEQALAQYAVVIEQLAAGYQSLAELARSQISSKDADAVLDKLTKAIDDLLSAEDR